MNASFVKPEIEIGLHCDKSKGAELQDDKSNGAGLQGDKGNKAGLQGDKQILSPDLIRSIAPGLPPWDLERLQQQLNSSTQTSSSEFDSLVDMLGSREQRIVPLMTSSWLENINKYSELEGDSAIFASQDSLEVLNWNTHDCGRPGSPLLFDHEEILHIDEDEESDSGRGHSLSPARHLDSTGCNWRAKFSDADVGRLRNEFEHEFETKMHRARGCCCKCTKVNREDEEEEDGTELRRQCTRLTDEKRRLTDQMTRLQRSHEEMKSVIVEYESTIQKLIAGKEGQSIEATHKDVIFKLTKERDQAIDDLRSVERAFSDLHRRFEKMKQTLDVHKKNEDALRRINNELQEKMKKLDEKYNALKLHAEEK